MSSNQGERPVYGAAKKFQTDPHWRDLLLFYEYFHGNNGNGIGASHQTGWTGCIAQVMQTTGILTPELISQLAINPEVESEAMRIYLDPK